MLWLCFQLPSCLLGNTRDMSVMHEKAKCVCFIYMQPQKVKFKSVQINMKQVSFKMVLRSKSWLKQIIMYVCIRHTDRQAVKQADFAA